MNNTNKQRGIIMLWLVILLNTIITGMLLTLANLKDINNILSMLR